MPIEIPDLDTWNRWVTGDGHACGCCGMTECDAPTADVRERLIEAGALWWELLLAAEESGPSGVDATFDARRWFTLTREGVFSWADTEPTSPVGPAGALTFSGTGTATLVLTYDRQSDGGGATYDSAASGIVTIEQSDWEDDAIDPGAASLYQKTIVVYTPATVEYAEYLIYERMWGLDFDDWDAAVPLWASDMLDWRAEDPANEAPYDAWFSDYEDWEDDYTTWKGGGSVGMPPLPPTAPVGAPEAPELSERPEDPGNTDPTGWSAKSTVETYENHTGTLLDTTDPYYHGWHTFPLTISTFISPPAFTIERWPFNAEMDLDWDAVDTTDTEGFTASRTYTAWDSTTSEAEASTVTGADLFGTISFEAEVDPLFDGMTDEDKEGTPVAASPVAHRKFDIYDDDPWIVVDSETEESRLLFRFKIPYPWERSDDQTYGSYFKIGWGLKFTPQVYLDWQTDHTAWEARRDAWVAEDPDNNDPDDYATSQSDAEPEEPTDPGEIPELVTDAESPVEWSYPTDATWLAWADDYEDYLDDLDEWEDRVSAWIAVDPENRDEADYLAEHPADPEPEAPDEPESPANPWYTEWVSAEVPATTTEDEPKQGTVEIVNVWFECYHGAVYGVKPQYSSAFNRFEE